MQTGTDLTPDLGTTGMNPDPQLLTEIRTQSVDLDATVTMTNKWIDKIPETDKIDKTVWTSLNSIKHANQDRIVPQLTIL